MDKRKREIIKDFLDLNNCIFKEDSETFPYDHYKFVFNSRDQILLLHSNYLNTIFFEKSRFLPFHDSESLYLFAHMICDHFKLDFPVSTIYKSIREDEIHMIEEHFRFVKSYNANE